MKLATRRARLQAIIIDIIGLSFISVIIALPIMFLKINIMMPLFLNQIIMFTLGLVIFYFINRQSLVTEGQTMGKSILKIKIVNVDYTSSSENTILKRYLLLFLPSTLPVIGVWLATLNCAFIFTKDKKCLHDIITKTIVVECTDE